MVMLRPRRASKGEQTSARIRETALDLFSRLGFERVTMADIAAAAGVSQPTLHYHFDDKAQLWRAAMLDLAQVIHGEMRLLAAAVDAPRLVRIRMAVRVFLRVSWEHPALGRIIALEGMAGGERLEWLDANVTGAVNRTMVVLVQDSIDHGILKPFPAAQIVATIQAAAIGVINLAPMMRVTFGVDAASPEARAAHEDMIVHAVLGGLLTPEAAAA